MSMTNFQFTVRRWVLQAFGEDVANDMQERGDRLLEEVLELLQANGYDKSRVATLRDYVWGRPVGDPFQEVGGVTITLAAYCGAMGIDMHEASVVELSRIYEPEVLEKIRTKQSAKRDIHSPLPGPSEQASPPTDDTELQELRDQLKAGDEDWQRVCDALGARGNHFDPDDVLARIERLTEKSKPMANLLRSALEIVHGNALSLRDGEQVDGLVVDPQALAELHALERLASRLALAIKEHE